MNIIKKFRNFLENYLFCLKLISKANKSNFIIILLINIFSNIMPFITLLLGRNIINSIFELLGNQTVENTTWSKIITYFVIYFGLSILSNILLDFSYKLSIIQIQDLLTHLNITLMKKSVQIDLSFFDIPDKFDEMNRSRQNTHALHQIVFSTVSTCSNILKFVFFTIAAINFNVFFAVLIFLSLIPNFLFTKSLEKRNYDFDKSLHRDNRKCNYFYSLIFDREAAKEFRFFGIGDLFLNKFLELQKAIVNRQNKYYRKNEMKKILLDLPTVFIEILLQIFVVMQIIRQYLTIGDFSYITGIYNNLKAGIKGMSGNISMYIGYNQQIEDFKRYFLFSESEVCNGNLVIDQIKKIEFFNVSFFYPNCKTPVLNNLNFTISKGEKIALIGINGSGKSTIIKLITRFYEPTSGDILVNGKNINEYDIETYRKKISSVFQDYNIYSFTIRENVAVSDMSEINNDIKIKNALDFSEFNNENYLKNKDIDTYLGRSFEDNGIELSGGQNQKVAISRAVFRNADLVLLDEPTASLDPEAEYKVLSYFKKLYSDKTLLMISHRLTNTKLMDKILVIENGSIVEEGNHEKLMSLKSRYAFLYNIQAEKYLN